MHANSTTRGRLLSGFAGGASRLNTIRLCPRRTGSANSVRLSGVTSIVLSPPADATVSCTSLRALTFRWSETIDVPGRDLITIQDSLAARLVSALRVSLSAEERDRIGRRPTQSSEAYEFYLKGRDLLLRYVLKSFEDADLDAAIKAFHEAEGLDPAFAGTHAALGRCYILQSQRYGGTDSLALAERSLRKALDLPTLTAIQFNPLLRGFFERLVAAGKPKMQAVGACMRKLVMICYGVLKNRQPFDPAWASRIAP